jgi:hypothetical protein
VFFLASLIGFCLRSRPATAAAATLHHAIAQSHARWVEADAAVMQLAGESGVAVSRSAAESAREQARVEYQRLVARLMR